MSSIKYWSVGDVVAGCWNIGKKLKREGSQWTVD
jgi:hypothetical protein